MNNLNNKTTEVFEAWLEAKRSHDASIREGDIVSVANSLLTLCYCWNTVLELSDQVGEVGENVFFDHVYDTVDKNMTELVRKYSMFNG